MRLCCLFNTKKRYAYQVSKFIGRYEVEKVVVSDCKICSSRKVKKIDCLSKEHQSFLCETAEEVIRISRANGISLLGEIV